MDTGFRIEDLFEVVIQPEHSKGILINLQTKYKISTKEFLAFYHEGIPVPIPPEDIDNWLFQYELFIAAEGDLGELIEGFSSSNGNSCGKESFSFFDDPFSWEELMEKVGQPDKNGEEVILTSSFSFLFCQEHV